MINGQNWASLKQQDWKCLKLNYKDQIDNIFKFRGNNCESIRNKNYKLTRTKTQNQGFFLIKKCGLRHEYEYDITTWAISKNYNIKWSIEH